MIGLIVNGKVHDIEADRDTPLLWVLREQLGLTGTKFGCGQGLCGSCAVLIDGEAIAACSLPLSTVEGKGDHHHRGAGAERRAAPRAAGLARPRRAAMRLLPERHDHGGGRPAEQKPEADRRRHRRGDHQHLSLRHLRPGARGHSPRRREDVTEVAATGARSAGAHEQSSEPGACRIGAPQRHTYRAGSISCRPGDAIGARCRACRSRCRHGYSTQTP